MNRFFLLTALVIGCSQPAESEKFPPWELPSIPDGEAYRGQVDPVLTSNGVYVEHSSLAAFEGTVILEDSKSQFTFTGDDLAYSLALYVRATRELYSDQYGDRVQQCVSNATLVVPRNHERMNEFCSPTQHGCVDHAHAFGVETDTQFVMAIRWDWYRQLGNPTAVTDYLQVVFHEIHHFVLWCAHGTWDGNHNLRNWNVDVPYATDLGRMWLRETGRLED